MYDGSVYRVFTGVIVRIVPFEQLEHICHGPAGGCAFWRRQPPCVIYLPRVGERVTPQFQEETLEHELRHCRVGKFHPE